MPLPGLDIARWRNLIKDGRASIAEQFFRKQHATIALRHHAQLVDGVLREIWRDSDLPASAALVAVGGYGRGLLFPHSDVDLLLLLESGPDAEAAARLEQIIGLFWDIGLDVGHSVRTVQECLEESVKDVTIQTNLLEARLLSGNPAIFERLLFSLHDTLDRPAFLQAKLLEQQQRHARFHDTAYNLEPNLKESPGGLRDLQTVLWISEALKLGSSWKELVAESLITAQEARQIQRNEQFLQGLRIRLHYLAQRREDRLLFDFQTPLAEQLGLINQKNRSASELLMQRYYRTAKAVSLMNEILLQNLGARLRSAPAAPPLPVSDRFRARNQLLEACDEAVFQREPDAILECFQLLQRHGELKGICAPTLRALWRAVPMIDAAFRRDPANQARFMDIIREPGGLTHVLRRMNQYGVLGRYIPAFGRIVGQMQHDLFHVYTVDEHTLMVLRNLRRFTVPEFAHEFPLCSRLIGTFERPEVLYLAALFHDIAKGRGGDHSRLGKTDALRFCRQHGLNQADTELVGWLVESHLTMSAVAQKQDISDPEVIAAFGSKMRDERHLTALYLLTVADIRGTSPKVWNAWKNRLLESLYHATCRFLCGAASAGEQQLHERQRDALSILRQHAVPESAAKNLWAKLDEGYFMRHEAQEIAWHTRVLGKLEIEGTPFVRARLAPSGEGLQVMIYTPDRDDLFARICGFFERVGFNIVEAKIHTTRSGDALDSFVVLDEEQRATHYRDLLNYIEYELAQQLRQAKPLEEPSRGRVSRHLKHFPITPQVSIRPDEKGQYQVLSLTAGDRPGLLYSIARVFLVHGVHLHTAKINTLGERAEDTFLISGALMEHPKAILQFETELLKQLQS
ncbi:MAG: [protein-PII] uridylyltransferase [Nitrosomonadales bacterium]|nr:MAG: [protein-PII] uridylyltransferase [Nitrosomonadales bacterium]